MSHLISSIRFARGGTLAIVLAGGRGTRLHQLTAHRAKPAVPFGGKFRIIDFVLSNCINSGIRRICILTQFKAHSLIRHIQYGWSFHRPQFGEYIEVLPAQKRVSENWYLGTADAVFQNLDIIESHQPEYVLVLAGDHIYKMDYGVMLARHIEHDAEVTVGCVDVSPDKACDFGLMQLDDDDRVTNFVEKPADPTPYLGANGYALASMGIYLFTTEFLFSLLGHDAGSETSSHDFGKDIIPSLINDHRVFACAMEPDDGKQRYWRDVGTVDAYWEASIDLIAVTPELNLYETDWPIMTRQEQFPPAKFVFNDDDGRRGTAIDSLVASGTIVSGGRVERSLLSTNVHINSYAQINDSVLLPGVQVGRSARIRRAIIDSNCNIPAGMVIGEDIEEDRKRFHVSPKGIVLVSREMLDGEAIHVD